MKTLNIPVEVPDDFPSEIERNGKLYEPQCVRTSKRGDIVLAIYGGAYATVSDQSFDSSRADIILREIQMPPRPDDAWLDEQPCDAGATWRIAEEKPRVPKGGEFIVGMAGGERNVEVFRVENDNHGETLQGFGSRRWIVRKVPRVAETVRCEIDGDFMWYDADGIYRSIMDAFTHPSFCSLELADGTRVTRWDGEPFTGTRRVVAVHLTK